MMIDCPTDRIILPRRSSITELDSNKRCYPGGYFDPLGAYRVYASKRLFIFLAPPRTYT